MLRNFTTCFVGPSVRPSVGHTLLFCVFAVFGLSTPAQMIKWPQIQPLPTRTRLGLPCIRWFDCLKNDHQFIWLPLWFVHPYIYSFNHSFIHSFIHSYIPSFINSFFHSLMHSLIYSFFKHSCIHSCIHSFILSLFFWKWNWIASISFINWKFFFNKNSNEWIIDLGIFDSFT